MKYTQLFSKTTKNISAETESLNAKLLTQAGYIYQEMAGVYAYLPLGLRVIRNIEALVRTEMNKISSEALLPALSLPERWHTTKRHDSIDVLMSTIGASELALAQNNASYILNPTHEDLATPLAKSFRTSYKDFPFSFYQIQTKFRNEARAKSGLLRCREFIMKDMYSFHTTEADLSNFYEAAKQVYTNIYMALGIGEDTFVTLASGGDFTTNYSHEFQTILETGEDTIYLDRANNIAYNKEVTTPADAEKLGVDFTTLEQVKASEVGNIFPLGTKFSELVGYKYSNAENQQELVWMGSYGIGISRLMGVVCEKLADEKGLVWPKAIAPFAYHIVALPDASNLEVGEKIYNQLGEDNCLFDDRADISPGQKFGDADLMGCPTQIIISKKTLEQESVEIKHRKEGKTELVKLAEIQSLVN